MPDYARMQSKTGTLKELLVSRETAADLLGISIRSVDYLITQGKLPARKFGRRTLIPSEAIAQLASVGIADRISLVGATA